VGDGSGHRRADPGEWIGATPAAALVEGRGEGRGKGTRMARVSGWLGFPRSHPCVGSAARGRCRWASTERSVGRQVLHYDWLLGCAWLLFSFYKPFPIAFKKRL
jgi:hypothetical protein